MGHANRSSKRSDLLRLVRVDPKSTVPLLAQLEEQFAWLIASGQVKAGEALPSARELALHLGIHRHTVRTAYRRLVVRGLARSRPGRAVEALPAERAPPLPEGRRRLTFTIGVLVPGLNPFYDPFLRGIQDASRESPWLSFPCYAYNDPQLAARYLRELVAKGVDGLILAAGLPQAADGTPRLESLPAGMPPTVYADLPEMPGHAVLLDSEGAGCQATRHLLQHGHRRIGMISGPLQWPNLYACQRGYRRALEVAGIQPDPYLLVEDPDFTLEAGGRAVERLLAQPAPPTAVFGAADVLAIGAMRAVQARGLRVPDDIAIVGYNDIELAALVEPALTTVAAPGYEMGVAAMTMLIKLMAGHSPRRRRIRLPTRLIVRRSCGC